MNVLLITADQWRSECLSALGHPVLRTPHLDALAAEGLAFTRHYAQAVPCGPSRASLHTGLYLKNHRSCLNGTPLDARLTNWALETRKAGYDPALFGYTDTSPDPRGLDPGDPKLTNYSEPLPGVGVHTPYWHELPVAWVESLRTKGYAIPERLWDLYLGTEPGIEWEDGGTAPLALAIKAEDHETPFMVDACLSWVAEQTRPWIAHLSLLRPHPPFVAPAPYNTLYDPGDMAGCSRRAAVEEEAAQHPWLAEQLDRFRAPADDKKLARMKASYYGLMNEVDDNLGRLFAALKELGKWDDTLVIFTSDHGEQLGDHWLVSKSGYFDASYHVPLIIRDPRPVAEATRGQQVTAFTENVDIMPTLLDWLELPVPESCDGHSLLPFLKNPRPRDGWRREARWEYDFRDVTDPALEEALGLTMHQCALSVLRGERYKYVHFTALPPLFFDLQEDPGEFNNLADDPAHQSLVLEYAQKMLSWRMNHEDRGLASTKLTPEGPVTRTAPTVQLGT